MLIDSHCHLDWNAFDEDRDAVLVRAQQGGVEKLINPGVDLESSAQIIKLAEAHEAVFAAVGVHPNDSNKWNEESLQTLAELAAHSKVVAIGEIGLDYHWDTAAKDVQFRALEAQLELAAQLEKPVILHNRESNEDLTAKLLEWQRGLEQNGSPLATRPGVFHSFSGDQVMAEKVLAANFFISLTGPITFKNAKDLQTLAAKLPLDRLLVETDSPFLSPHPERGQRNEPAKVKLVAEKLAELLGCSFDEVASATSANAQQLFQFGGAQ